MRGYKEDGRLVLHRRNRTIYLDLRDYDWYWKTKAGNFKPLKDSGFRSFFSGLKRSELLEISDPYGKLLYGVARHRVYDGRLGVATQLRNLKDYRHLESYLAIGIQLSSFSAFSAPVTQFPKAVRRVFQDVDYGFDVTAQSRWNEYPELIQNICTHLITRHRNDLEVYKMFVGLIHSYSAWSAFLQLVGEYNCEYKSLINYLIRIVRTEATILSDAVTELRDYLRMANGIEAYKAKRDGREVSQHEFGRVEKYPKHLTIRHRVVTQNYSALKQVIDLQKFQSRLDSNFEWKGTEYCVVSPATPEDIKDEGSALHHCVASYVDRVMDGTTQILFLRTKQEPEESLVTIEVRNHRIQQARGYNNRPLEKPEVQALEKYAKAKNLDYMDVKRDKSKPSPTPNKEKTRCEESSETSTSPLVELAIA